MLDKNSVLAEAKGLVARELKLCRTLRAMISRELETIVLDGDMDELFKILVQKDEIVSQLQLLADAWRDLLCEAGLFDSDSVNTVNFSGQILNIFPNDIELSELIAQTHEAAGSVVKAEDEAISELEKHSSGLRSQMTARIRGRNAAASYARMGGSLI